MPTTKIFFSDDAFEEALTWDNVIGVDTHNMNIVAESSDGAAILSATISSRAPNRKSHPTSLSGPIEISLLPRGDGRFTYFMKENDLNTFFNSEDTTEKYAFITRPGGTSAAIFADELGWANRGEGELPDKIDPATNLWASAGSEVNEVPDSAVILRSGGVEVIEVSIFDGIGDYLTAKALVRSPADVLYFSGHADSYGFLSQADGQTFGWPGDPNADADARRAILSAIVSNLSSAPDLSVIALAGCEFLREETRDIWAQFVRRDGDAVLGYEGLAPVDSANDTEFARRYPNWSKLTLDSGENIAAMFARDLRDGSEDIVTAWLSANANSRSWHAAGIDRNGFWHLDEERIFGKVPIPAGWFWEKSK